MNLGIICVGTTDGSVHPFQSWIIEADEPDIGCAGLPVGLGYEEVLREHVGEFEHFANSADDLGPMIGVGVKEKHVAYCSGFELVGNRNGPCVSTHVYAAYFTQIADTLAEH